MAKKIDVFNASDKKELTLLENSVHYLSGDITEDSMAETIKWLIYENLSYKEPRTLTLYINSTGGDLYQSFALIDMMRTSQHTIRTIGIGSIMSAAFLIFISGTRGERILGSNTGIMMHQYTDEAHGKHDNLKSTIKEGDNCNTRMIEIIKNNCDLPINKIRSKLVTPIDSFFTASEMVDLGLADHII